MGALRTIILTLASAGALAAPAMAREDDWPEIKGARLDGQRPWGAFAIYRSPSLQVTGVSLYLRKSASENEMVARRVEGTEGGGVVVTWASSKTCETLIPLAAEMEELPVPRIEVPGAGREPRPAEVLLDGSSYFVWADDARFSGGAHSAQLEMRGVDGSPMAQWIDKALAGLGRCWRTNQP